MQVHSALFFETPEQIYARVFRELRPCAKLPAIEVRFCSFANADSHIRLEEGRLLVRITDVLNGAPAPIQEALAYILLGKLFRRAVPAIYEARYRRYLNRPDLRRSLHLLRQIRGRKYVSGPKGAHVDLEALFEDLNLRFFHGLLGRPMLGWSRRPSRTTLGHYDPSHNAIILSSLLDRPEVPRVVVEYVLFHEMLHLRCPAEHRGVARRLHTAQFREAEKQFPGLREAKMWIRKM